MSRSFAERPESKPRFDPIVNVEFYPNDTSFDELVGQLRSTFKTYELFAVARLFLVKPERFAMVVKKKDNCSDKTIYSTADDGFVFDTEAEAVAHVISVHLDKYFDSHESEVPPPNGTFTVLHKCGMTGRVLCPPNYHEYQKILIDHHDRYLPMVPFEKFKANIVKTIEQSEIDAWKESASKITVYTPKSLGAGDESTCQVELKSNAELQTFLIEHFKDKAIVEYESVRVPGEVFSKMPRNLMSKSLFVTIEREKTFPLNFANNLRGRFRRAHFTIYKIGGKSGISYICGIKRKFRTVGEQFIDSMQPVISYIDAHKRCRIKDLLRHFGINDDNWHVSVAGDSRDRKSGDLSVLEGISKETRSSGQSRAEVGTVSENGSGSAESSPVGNEGEAIAGVVQQNGKVGNLENAAAENIGSDDHQCAGESVLSVQKEGTPSEDNQNSQLRGDVAGALSSAAGTDTGAPTTREGVLKSLHWLIKEGYVAEFENGTLLATEFMPKPAVKDKQANIDCVVSNAGKDDVLNESAESSSEKSEVEVAASDVSGIDEARNEECDDLTSAEVPVAECKDS